MSRSPEYLSPLSWSSPSFSLEPYDIVIFPGGHDKAVRQVIDSPRVHTLVVDHFPRCQKPSRKIVGAVCHGVMVLSSAKSPATGDSVIKNCETTALPSGFEQAAYWSTRVFLGDYYKTYGAGSEDVQTSVGHPMWYLKSWMPARWHHRVYVLTMRLIYRRSRKSLQVRHSSRRH